MSRKLGNQWRLRAFRPERPIEIKDGCCKAIIFSCEVAFFLGSRADWPQRVRQNFSKNDDHKIIASLFFHQVNG